MSPSLISLAHSLREALASPASLQAESEAEKNARLDILDMIPDLNRTLIGEFQALRDMSMSFLPAMVLNAICTFKIPQLVPLEAESSISYTDLAAQSNMDITPLRQILRQAMTSSIFTESSPDHISHTSTSRLLASDPKAFALIDYLADTLKVGAAHQIEALQRWKGSTSARETGLSLAWGKPGETDVWEDMEGNWKFERFSTAMEVWTVGEGWGPEYLVNGYGWGDLGEGVVVDLGGSNGFISHALKTAFPSLTFIVQDLEFPTRTLASSTPGITYQTHDFFTPQPVHGADIYLFRWVMHNWNEQQALTMLRNLIPALKPGAKVVINDGCLPVPGTGRRNWEVMARNVDLAMMITMNARERDEEDWKALFEKADARFRYLGASRPAGSMMSIMEAVWEGA